MEGIALSSIRFKSEEEAKKKAKEDLKALIKQASQGGAGKLSTKQLSQLREDIERRKDDVDRELIFNIEKKVHEISKGVQMLSDREEVTKDMRAKISSIRDLWEQSCGRFSDISEHLDELLLKKRNVEQVLGMLKNFLDMEANVEELQKKLRDEDEIFGVYKKIKIMNYMRTSFLNKIENQQETGKPSQSSATQQQKLARIKEHFRAVRDLEQLFHEHVIQGNLQNIHNLAKKNPQLLVKVLRVIENEEVTNESLSLKQKEAEEEEKKRLRLEMLGRESELIQQLPGFQQAEGRIFKKGAGDDAEFKELGLKEKAINVLKQVIKRRASEFYEAAVEGCEGSSANQMFNALLARSRLLIQDLKLIRNLVEPCFPPSYKIFDLHFTIYKQEMLSKIDSVLGAGQKMEQLLTEDPESILAFSGMVQECNQLITELQCQDDFFINLQIRMEEYYPRFMDHAENMILEKLQRVLEESKAQEVEKMESAGKALGKKKKMTYDTTLSTDLFDFMSTQLDAIKESLSGEKLVEFIKRMLDQLVSLVQHLAEDSMSQDPKNNKLLIVLSIRMNDMTKIASEFGKFKDQVIQSVGEGYQDRVDNLLDGYFRQMIEWANIQSENIALFIVRGDMQEDYWLHFFTIEWSKGSEVMIQEVLKCANSFLKDVNRMITDERFFGKVAESLQIFVSKIYFAITFTLSLSALIQKGYQLRLTCDTN